MTEVLTIPGIPVRASAPLLQLLQQHLGVVEVWLFGSRALGRQREGSDLDLCLVGDALTHLDRVQLLHGIDELLLPWSVELVLRHELNPALLDHLGRVGRCLWKRVD